MDPAHLADRERIKNNPAAQSIAQRALSFEPLNPARSDFVSDTHLAFIQAERTEFIRATAYNSVCCSADGKEISRRDIVIEQRPEDVVGVFAVYAGESGTEPQVVLTKCLRPALVGRKLFHLPLLGNENSVKIVSEAGGYLGDDGVEATTRKVLQEKLGIFSSATIFSLGGSVLPNAAASPELHHPFLALLEQRPGLAPAVCGGTAFSDSREVHAVPLSSVITDFLRGELLDPRLFEDACRAADFLLRHKNIKIGYTPSSGAIKTADSLRASLRTTELVSVTSSSKKLLSRDEAIRILTSTDPGLDVVASIKLFPLNEIPEESLYKAFHFCVENSNQHGKVVGPRYGVDAVVRKNDMLLITACGKVNEELYMLVNIGAREALELRDESPRALHTITGARNLEGPGGSLPASEEHIATRIIKEAALVTQTQTGTTPLQSAIPTSIQGYWSPGFNSSGFRHCLQPLLIDQDFLDKMPEGSFLMRPRDILKLGEQGVVRDLSLLVSARILTLLCPELCPGQSDATKDVPLDVLQKFNRLTIQEPPLMTFVREYAPRLAHLMKSSPLLSNVITRRANSGGVTVEEKEPGDPEAYFFNANMESFMIHPGDNPLRVSQLLWHDLWHFEYKDPLPFRLGDNGALIQVSFEEYKLRILRNEGDAAMFSEVILPQLYSIDRFERESGDKTIAGLFADAGITLVEDQRAVIQAALVKGEVDERIAAVLRDKDLLASYESVIRERFLGHYVRDLKNTRTQYDFWTANTDCAMTALAMGAALCVNDDINRQTFSDRMRNLIYSEDGRLATTGFNPLKSFVAEVRTHELFMRALRLSYIAQHIDPQSSFKEPIQRTLDDLKKASRTLDGLLDGISGIEASPGNISAFEITKAIQNSSIFEASELEASILATSGVLPAVIRQELLSRPHAPLPLLPYDEREDAIGQAKITEILNEVLS